MTRARSVSLGKYRRVGSASRRNARIDDTLPPQHQRITSDCNWNSLFFFYIVSNVTVEGRCLWFSFLQVMKNWNPSCRSSVIDIRFLFLRSYQRYTTTRRHSTCQLRLTLHTLTGWLASLDLCKPYTSGILSHRIASRNPPRLIPLSTNTQDSLVP